MGSQSSFNNQWERWRERSPEYERLGGSQCRIAREAEGVGGGGGWAPGAHAPPLYGLVPSILCRS